MIYRSSNNENIILCRHYGNNSSDLFATEKGIIPMKLKVLTKWQTSCVQTSVTNICCVFHILHVDTPDVTMFLYNYNGVIVYSGKIENYTKKTTTKIKQLNKHKTKQ